MTNDPAAAPTLGFVSDAIAEMLRRLEIPYIALNPGASYRGLHDSLVNYLGNTRPEIVLALHEEHAVAIAHGYAKVTGRPMAAALHSNVGLMHGSMAIFDAWCDRMPVVVLGAQGPLAADRRRPWIDWVHTVQDLGALVRDYTKWDDQPTSLPAALESILRAYQQAAADMIERTSTNLAPWTLIGANDKYHARVKVLETLVLAIEDMGGGK